MQPVAWTPAEWRAELARGNPIAREAVDAGVWVLGDRAAADRAADRAGTPGSLEG